MDEQAKETNTVSNGLLDLLFILRKNLLIILLIVALAVGGGWIYAKTCKPNYVAREKINYRVDHKLDPGEEESEGQKNTYEINYMSRYVDTVMSFCKTEVVLDRANYYYIQYKEKDGTVTLDEYINEVLTSADTYEATSRTGNSYYITGNVGVGSEAKQNESASQVFTISYKDASLTAATEKVKILALACNMEAKDFFPTVTTRLVDLGSEGYSTDVSKNRIMIMSFIIGVVLAAVVVYARVLFDRTIKTKDELERITGVSMLSAISEQDEALHEMEKRRHKHHGRGK